MTIKIDAPRERNAMCGGHPTGYRLVRESDWRKIMSVVRAAEHEDKNGDAYLDDLSIAVTALRKHLAKK